MADFDDIEFEDRRDRAQLIAASRNLLADCRRSGATLQSIALRENNPRRYYVTRGSGMRSPALSVAELGEPEPANAF